MNFNNKIIATFLFLLSSCSKCNLIGECVGNNYGFIKHLTIAPTLKAINLGDTLWIYGQFSTLIEDQTGKTIDYSGAQNLATTFVFQKLVPGDWFRTPSADKFKTVALNGREIASADKLLVKEFLFEEKNGNYILKVGFVAKETGTFGIIMGNAPNVFRKNLCDKAHFIFNFSNQDRHPELRPDYNGASYPPGGDYFFIVE